ncbi:protein of unknown function [Legionella pneumophila subsp. pneumophila]|nr:protein of unknown function [Legionella pneumophila subsp. pneumophila]
MSIYILNWKELYFLFDASTIAVATKGSTGVARNIIFNFKSGITSNYWFFMPLRGIEPRTY